RPTRLCRPRSRRTPCDTSASIAFHPAFVAIASRPSLGWNGRIMRSDLGESSSDFMKIGSGVGERIEISRENRFSAHRYNELALPHHRGAADSHRSDAVFDHGVAAAVLGGVERGIRRLDQVAGALARIGSGTGDADARSDTLVARGHMRYRQ